MVVLTLAQVARADPVALRGVALDGLALAVGTSSASAGLRVRGVDLAVDLGWDGLATGLSAGRRGVLVGDVWRVDGGVSAGIVVLPYASSFALEATPWVGAGRVGERGAIELRLAVPLAASLEGLRVPGSVELVGGAKVSRAWVTPRIAVAPVWTPGLDVAFGAEVGLVVCTAWLEGA